MVRINVFSFQDMQYERKNIFKNRLNIKNNVIYTQMFTSLYFSEFKQWILSSVVPACLYNLYLNRRCKCDHKTNISYIFFLPFNYQVSVLLTIYHQKVLNLKKNDMKVSQLLAGLNGIEGAEKGEVNVWKYISCLSVCLYI